MKHFFLLVFLCCTVSSFSQQESIGPITSVPDLNAAKNTKRSETFDSTFIYAPDTLSLPVFDEFSGDHFQHYKKDYTDPTITSDKRYHLVNNITDLPLPVNLTYTSQQTMRKKITVSTLSVEDELFTPTTIKVGSLATYPVTYVPTDVYPPFIIYDTLDFPNPEDTIWLDPVEYVQDSATQFFVNLNDKNAFWLDSNVTHSYTNAVDPWSLGVATFDGIAADGSPYQFGSTSIDYNDFLTSKYIDLSTYTPNDSIYLSFLYQPMGFNDEPEATDSLVLEFYAPFIDQWFWVWSTAGSPVSDFKPAHIKITDFKYFQPNFQFRIKNYGGVSGAIDQFHVDYINLRALSGFQDTLFKDFAVVYPVTTLLKDYTQVPWDHYKNNPAGKMTDQFRATVRNGSNTAENNQNGEVIVSYQGVTEGNFPLVAQDLSGGFINYGPRTVYESLHDLSGGYQFDETKIGDFQEFDVKFYAKAQFPNTAINDTTYHKQRFYDAYAYDDGSAEAAYGPTGVQARLAYQFLPYEDDSLVGVKIRFVPSVNDVSSKFFFITVWDDNNGQPGNVIYQDDFLNPRQPSYSYDDSLGFTNYYLKDFAKLPVNGRFYIGWKQLDQDRLNVGMDMNTDHSDKIFYSINNEQTWNNTIFDASLLMRPVFATMLNRTLSTNEPEEKEVTEFTIYPNPAAERISIRTDFNHYKGIAIYDLQGKLILASNGEEHDFDISGFDAGVYLVKDLRSGTVRKMIKN